MKQIALIILLLTVILANKTVAQGCSDAGFCTIGNLNHLQNEDDARKHQKISLLLPFGIGDETVFVFTPGLQYDNRFSKQWALQAKLTTNTASGNLGNATGLGDLFLSGTYSFPSKTKWNVSATLGTKLPLNKSDLEEGNKPLPMQYQGSLGTVDLITGVSITNNKWQFAGGWQQPLSGKNSNQFLPIYWNTADAVKYPPSKDFSRKSDVLLRAAYLYQLSKKFSLNGGLLGIYHLGKDNYINQSNQKVVIAGSEGLTINITLAAWYKINNRLQIGCIAGTPLVVRDVRPDGLTRKFVFSPEISWTF